VRVFAYVPEQYIPYITKAEKVFLRFQEYPGRDFVGTVSNISGGVDPTTKTLQVEIHVPNADQKLLPGMYVQARFQAPSHIKLPIVPSTTLQTRPDGSFMYTVDGHHIVHVHKVDIGRDLGGQLEIAGGIKIGDKVILSPSDQIQDGILVMPVVAPLAQPTVSATKAAK
jgi:RND family efflux transporter MFP subunit